MNTRALLILWFLLAGQAWGYVYSDSTSTWQPGPIPFQIKLGSGTTLQDGTNHSTSVQAAMTAWNAQLGTVQFAPTIVAQSSSTDPDHEINEIVFASTVENQAYGEGVLAITVTFTIPSIHQRVTSDIFFNTARTWDSYGGPLQPSEDIRRVALHELGHALGLDHPDQNGQTVTAVMNSTVSGVDALAADDIAGAQNLYRAPGDTTPAANNSFVGATSITLSNNAAQLTGTNYYANKEGGEPNHAAVNGGRSVWWRWTAPDNGPVTLSTEGSHFDTLLAVYTGSTVNALSGIVANDDAPGTFGYSTVSFTATGGTTYSIAVDGFEAESGHIALAMTFNPPVVNTAPAITGHPTNQTVNVMQLASFSVSASGSPAPSYQWQRLPSGQGIWANLGNGSGYSGVTTTTLNVNPTNEGMSGDQFRCVATNVAGSATSNPATLTVTATAPAILGHPQNKTVDAGQSTTFSVSTSGTPTPTCQWQRKAAGSDTWNNLGNGGNYSGVTTTTLTVSTVTLGMNGDQFRCVATNTGGNATSIGATLTVTSVIYTVSSASAGVYHSLSVRTDGTLWASGENSYGQLGDGTRVNRMTPFQLTTGVASVAAGFHHTLFVKTDGSLWAMGYNVVGALGDGTIDDRLVPVQVATGVASVSAGASYSLFVKTNGTLWGMGYNSQSQLGDGTTIQRNSPVQVATDVASVSAGGAHALFVKTDGTLWGMGYNNEGQLGDGTNNTRPTPVQLATGVVSVSAGGNHTMFVKTDGTLWAMGFNASGQLGDGTTTHRYSPVQVATGVAAVSAGGNHTIFVKTDGTLWAMGLNGNGQLGTGNTTASSLPIQIASQVAKVSTGRTCSLFVLADGTFWTVGENNYGQLADGTLTTRYFPVKVSPLAIGFPLIVTQPPSRTVNAGSTVTLTTTAYGTPAPTYQWRKDGTNIPGATTPSLTIPQVQLADAGSYTVVVSNPAGSTTSSAAVLIVSRAGADFNHDGHSDILWRNSSTNQVGLWLMDGTVSLGFFYVANESGDWKIFGTGDFNADGQSDFLWRNTATMQIGVWLMNGTASTGFVHLAQESDDWKIFGTGDFNNDGHSDLLWRNTATLQVGVRLMHGTDAIGFVYIAQESGDWKIFGTGDFNADGQSDLLWRNTATMQIGVWLMNGTTSTGFVYLANESGDWKIFGTGDFNADGQSDILWRNSDTDQVGIWLMDGLVSTGFVYVANESGEWKVINN